MENAPPITCNFALAEVAFGAVFKKLGLLQTQLVLIN
jgi:hypothetical protein